jgi:putative endonuclease
MNLQKNHLLTDSKKADRHKKQLGIIGEQYVADYLRHHGFIILEQNYRTRQGEIDLIAQKNNLIAFVEVKTRRQNYFNLSQVILPSKQRNIICTAENYLSKARLQDVILRFDVALITGENIECFTYIPNAFSKPEML